MAGLAVLGASPIAQAELPQLSDKTFAQMVTYVLTVDHLKTRCNVQATLAQTQTWEKQNDVDLIRQAIAQLEKTPSNRQMLATARQGIESGIGAGGHKPCDLLAASITLPDTQFAGSPQLAALRSEFGRPSAIAATAPVRDAATSRRMADLAGKIEGFGFDYMATVGIGGGMFMKVYPVVMFKDGQVLKDIEALSFAGGMEAHKRANPDDWSKWRREGQRLQTATKKGWENLPFTALYSKLPDGFKLNGRYQSLGGGGNTALGGGDLIAVWSTFDFLPDGRVVKGGGAGGYSSFQQASTAFSSVATDRRGRYRINGLMLEVTYDNGASEQFLIVSDPKDPSVIWLDGVSYTSKD